MRDHKPRTRLTFACSVAIAATLALSGSAEARQKKPTLMNSCSCACRQESATEVLISNKDFYAVSSCGSFSGTRCDVTVTTSEGTYTVSGTWEGCVDHGKEWVMVRQVRDGQVRDGGYVGRRLWLNFRIQRTAPAL